MRYNACHYSSHMPLLMKALTLTSGDVLEFGTGHYSTPLLHWLCEGNRKLLSVENDMRFYDNAMTFKSEWHDIWFVKDWDDERLDRKWGVVFIDHAPAIRRVSEVKRFAELARVVVLHDTDWRQAKHYPGMQDAYAMYKYVRHDHKGNKIPGTTLLSNYIEV